MFITATLALKLVIVIKLKTENVSKSQYTRITYKEKC